MDLAPIVTRWIDDVSAANKLPDSVSALLVGLFEGPDGYQIYLSGSNHYDADDDDWACNQDWSPQPRYLQTDVPGTVAWDAFQESAVEAVRSVINDGAGTILHASPHVSVGFDDGELVSVK